MTVAGAEVPSVIPAECCAKLCAETPCGVYDFYGFAPDSGRFGYAHLTCPGAHVQERHRFTWHVRHIHAGKGRLNTSGVALKDKVYPEYFSVEKYLVKELTGELIGKNSWSYTTPDGLELVVELKTEKKVAWYLTVLDGTRELMKYRGEFEEIYFSFKPRLYLAPDGRKLALSLTLDAMIKVDGALVVFKLPYPSRRKEKESD